MQQPSLEEQTKLLQDKLDLVLYYLHLVDGPYHAEGFDYTPAGWDISASELIRFRDSDGPLLHTPKFITKRNSATKPHLGRP